MKTVEIFEGGRAQTYDQSIRLWCPDYDFIHALLPAVLHYHLGGEHDKDILVVGSGTGTEVVSFLHFTDAWHITGVDPSSEMMSQAEAKLKSFSGNRYDLITGTVDALNQDKSYDAAVSVLLLQFLPDDGAKLQLLKEISKRLKQGGKLVFVDIFGEGDSLSYNLSLLRAFLSTKGMESDMIENGIRHIRDDLFPISQERLGQLLHEAGLGEIHLFTQSLVFGGWLATKLG